jgi:hypothetical protein
MGQSAAAVEKDHEQARNAGIVIPGCQGRRHLGTLDLDYVVRSRAPGSLRGFTPLLAAWLRERLDG